MSTTPERVDVETLRGDVRAGRVVARELEASASGNHYRLVVDVDGVRIAVDEDEVGRPR